MTETNPSPYIRRAAEQAHSLWSRWMKHYFTLKDPSEHYERWINLMHRPFDQLTEKEKESDYAVSVDLATALQQVREDTLAECREAVDQLLEAQEKRYDEVTPDISKADESNDAAFACAIYKQALAAIDTLGKKDAV